MSQKLRFSPPPEAVFQAVLLFFSQRKRIPWVSNLRVQKPKLPGVCEGQPITEKWLQVQSYYLRL